MFFDFLLNANFPNTHKKFTKAKELHNYCVTAEKSARTDPDKCFLNLGKAVEVLTKCLLEENGVDCSNLTLENMIKRCDYIKDKLKFHEFRWDRNRVAHIERDGKKKKTFPPITNACYKTVGLYTELCKIFHYHGPKLTADLLPIGDYEVINKVNANKFESIAGDFNYICKKSGSDIDAYAYVRPFNADENNCRNVFNERDLEVQNFFSNMRGSNYIIRGNAIHTTNICELRYLAYEIRQNTKTLDMLEDELSAYDVLDIISQITEGLSALSTRKINIHHRGIRPSCIFVNKYDDEYEAKLGCFETAKIEYKEREMRTVMSYMVESQKNNPFIHPELVGVQSASDEEWEKGDVYSLAAVLLYCLDKESVQLGSVDSSVLLDHFGDEFYTKLTDILDTGSLETVPLLKDFLEILEEEKENLN